MSNDWRSLLPPEILKSPVGQWRVRGRVRREESGGRWRVVQATGSQDFSRHRDYEAGDELRRLDWRVMARSDRNVVRLHESEGRQTIIFGLDASASMKFTGDHGISVREKAVHKGEYGRFLVVGATWQLLATGERVGFESEVRAGAGARWIERICAPLLEFEWSASDEINGGTTAWGLKVLTGAPIGSRVVLTGDFLDPMDGVEEWISVVRHRRLQLGLVRVRAQEEETFWTKNDGAAGKKGAWKSGKELLFRCLEVVGREVPASPKAVATTYLEARKTRERELQRLAQRTGGWYLPVTTSQPLAEVLPEVVRRCQSGRS